MPKVMTITASKFRFDGTRFTVFLKDKIKEAHDLSLQVMLETLVQGTPHFSGETQATFRQFRDYLAEQSLRVDLEDFPDEERIARYSPNALRKWHTRAKISNLPHAGVTTFAGKESAFRVEITKQGFKIHVNYVSGSLAFDENEDLRGLFDHAKDTYKQHFKALLEFLFSPAEFKKTLRSHFNRVTIRST